MIVKHAVGGTDDGLAVPLRIPRDTNPRLDVVFVSLNAFLQSEIVIARKCKGGGWFELWRNLDVVANAVVQGQVRTDAPRVLPKKSDRNVMERIAGTAETLNKIGGDARTVSLHCIEDRKRGWEGSDGAEVIHAAIVHGEGGADRKIIEISPELRVVATDAPGKIVGELIALFDPLYVGVRLATEECEAGDVHGRVSSSRNRGVVEVRKPAAGVLKAKFVHLVVADRPAVLRHSRNVSINLLRGPRISVLPEWLVFAADFNARDRAGATIGAQHKAIVGADVVIKTQRIKTGALKNGKVSFLRCQSLVGSGHKARRRRAGRGNTADSRYTGETLRPNSLHRHAGRRAHEEFITRHAGSNSAERSRILYGQLLQFRTQKTRLIAGHLNCAKGKRQQSSCRGSRIEWHQVEVVLPNAGKPGLMAPRNLVRKVVVGFVLLDRSTEGNTALHARIRGL